MKKRYKGNHIRSETHKNNVEQHYCEHVTKIKTALAGRLAMYRVKNQEEDNLNIQSFFEDKHVVELVKKLINEN